MKIHFVTSSDRMFLCDTLPTSISEETSNEKVVTCKKCLLIIRRCRKFDIEYPLMPFKRDSWINLKKPIEVEKKEPKTFYELEKRIKFLENENDKLHRRLAKERAANAYAKKYINIIKEQFNEK